MTEESFYINEQDWDRVTDPKNFFPTFTESEWVDWLLLGTYEEVGLVYLICIDQGFARKAEIAADMMRNWDEVWMRRARRAVNRGEEAHKSILSHFND